MAEAAKPAPPLVANVSIHGSFRDHHAGWAKNAKGRYLILHGAEDRGYPLPVVDKVVQELRDAKTPFQLEVYSGTGHDFSTPKNKDEERRTHSTSTAIQNQWTSNLRAALNFQKSPLRR